MTKSDASTGSNASVPEFKLTRDMLSTTKALLNLRNRGQAVYVKKLPFHKNVCDRLVLHGLVTLVERQGKKIMAITSAGRDALLKAGYRE